MAHHGRGVQHSGGVFGLSSESSRPHATGHHDDKERQVGVIDLGTAIHVGPKRWR